MAKRRRSLRKESTPKAAHELTEHERKALSKHVDRLENAVTAPEVKLTDKDGVAVVELEHPDATIARGLLMEALGTGSSAFFNGLLGQLINASLVDSVPDEKKLNFMVSVIKDIRPNDQLEAMLAAQIGTVHMTTMTLMGRLSQTTSLQQQDSIGNLLTKLMRTFSVQMETLKRYRTGGEQKVTVQHVSVNEGGQAIVGNINNQAPREIPSPMSISLPALTENKAVPMPMPRVDGKKRIPASRRLKEG